MRRFYALVEQLDLALEQLEVGTPAAARFALILVDNAVELILHTSCKVEVELDRHRSQHLLEPKYNEKKRREAIGPKFRPKVRFCRDLGIVTEEQLQTILSTHEYRNELYHTGLRYDDIILPLAWEYHGLACELLPKMRRSIVELVEPESLRVRKYFAPESYGLDDGDIVRAAASLSKSRSVLPIAPVEMLSRFAVDLMQDIGDALDFLVADNFRGWNQRRMLEEVQFHDYVFRDGDQPRIDTSQINSRQEFDDAVRALRKNWQPRYAESPVPRWLERAEQIRESNDWAHALHRFQRLRKESFHLSQILSQAATELDVAIQLEIDRRLEK